MDLAVTNIKLLSLNENLEDVEVLCIYGGIHGGIDPSLLSWLKKKESHFLVLIEQEEKSILKSKTLPLVKEGKVKVFHVAEGLEPLFLQIAWEFVLLRFGYATLDVALESEAIAFFERLEYVHRAVDLIASDSKDMGLQVLKNVVGNLEKWTHAKLFTSLKGGCKDLPAIICGAGTSLDDVAPFLADLKERAVLIGGGSAVSALNQYGITPHFYAHIDPHPPSDRLLKQDVFMQPFFYKSRVSSALLELASGPLVWMPENQGSLIETWIAQECGIVTEPLDTGWTVANVCAVIAEHLGCNPIILVGMDFACQKEEIYAAGLEGEEHKDHLIDIKEGELYSKKDWLMSAEWMGEFIKSHKESTWIHATTFGVALSDTQRMDPTTLLQLDALQEKKDVEALVHRLIETAEESSVLLEKIKDVKQKIVLSFDKSLQLCHELMKVWEKYYPHSPIEKPEYAVLEVELEQQLVYQTLLLPLWDVWKHSILRSHFHPLGQHVHRLLFFQNAIELHLSSLKEER